MADVTLDTQGLTCPLPILKLKKAMTALSPGSTLEIFATDPGSLDDFEAFCRLTGHTLLEQTDTSGVYRFLIQHTGAA
jgi:tRNA 2-thiouridine synthesizing protein A